MVIYLRHPEHGTKVAMSREEAKQDKSNGWEEFNPSSEKERPVKNAEIPDFLQLTESKSEG